MRAGKGISALGKSGTRSAGFTLVELIAVVAIISMIAVYITIEINQSSDDAKLGIATAFLTSSVPSAISSYRARHLGSCKGIDVDVTPSETFPIAAEGDTPSNTKFRLMMRGLAAETPWGDFWAAEFETTTREITIEFTLVGTNADSIALDLAANLAGKSQVISAKAEDPGLVVIYSCS